MEIPFIQNDYPPPKNLHLDVQQPDGRPAHVSTPGLELYCDFGSSNEIRGMHYVEALDIIIVVCGSSVYSVTGRQAYEFIDSLSTSSGWVYMTDNGIELIISDGTYAYVYDFTNTYNLLCDSTFGDFFFIKKSDGSIYGTGDNASGQLGDLTAIDKSSPVVVVGSHSFTSISGGTLHSIALKSNGEVWGWGENTNGQLGDNSLTDKSSPVKVVGSHSFNDVAAGYSHSIGLKSNNGTAWCWGVGTSGELGDNSLTTKSSPVSVVGAHSFVDIAGGRDFSSARKANGEVWTWGENDEGQLGDNTKTQRSSPVQITVGAGHTFSGIACGNNHALAVRSSGDTWCWGDNTNGQLGDSTTIERSSPVSVVGAHSFSEVHAGFTFSIGLKGSGEAWSWGANFVGQLGNGTTTHKSSPVQVVGDHSFVELGVSDESAYGRKADGSIWAWGRNNAGQLGDNSLTDKSSPVLMVRKFQPLSSIGPSNVGTITFIDGYIAANDVGTQRWYISALYEAANWPDLDYTSAEELPDDLVAVIMNQGELWALGTKSGEVYQNVGSLDFPFTRIPGAFLDVGCGAAASVAQNDNSIFWLDNDNRVRRAGGPLGYSSTVISTPAMDQELSKYGDNSDAEGFAFSKDGHDFYALTFPTIPKTWVYDITSSVQLKGNFWHLRETTGHNRWLGRCYARLKNEDIVGDYQDGKLYSMITGKLNDHGTAITRQYKGPVIRKDKKRIFFHSFEVELKPVQGIFNNLAKGQFGCGALKGNGEAWTWGVNTNGQLGDNTITNRSSPVSVVGAHNAVNIMRSQYMTVLHKPDGSVWTCGVNTNGRLGDNTGTNRSSPVAVVGSHSFTEVSAGDSNTVGLKASGEAWSWGNGFQGELGDNSTTSKSSPVSVVGSHSFSRVTHGHGHTLSLKLSGEVWSWGIASSGCLGDNTATSKSSPVAVVGSHSFTDIFAGYTTSFALKNNDVPWAWGNNTYGELGINSTASKSSPVAVVGSHSFTKIDGGYNHTLGLKANGTVWAWGRNHLGQLGDNTETSRSSPVQVVGSHSFVDITAGQFFSFARKANGQIWSWGDNTSGVLGDNTVTKKSSPVQVVMSYGAEAILDWENENNQWSSEQTLTIPTEDNTFQRSRVNRLGTSRNRQYRVRVTDPVDVTIKAAYVDIGEEG